MHVIFIPYGKVECVDVFLNDIRAQKYQMPFISPNGKTKLIWTNSQLRVLPFGFYEHVFPREMMHEVLTTLGFHEIATRNLKRYNIGSVKLAMIRKALRAKKAPEFKTDKQLLWMRVFEGVNAVHIIPIGIREDLDLTEIRGPNKGWTHEAI